MENIFKDTRPSARLLGKEQVDYIHSESLRILEKSGIRVDSGRALDLFRQSGGTRTDGNRVFLSPSLVNDLTSSAARNITIYNKDGTKAFTVGEDGDGITRFGTGTTNTGYQDPLTGKIAPFMRKHTRMIAALTSMLDAYDMVSTPGIPGDVPPKKIDLFNLIDIYHSSDKPMVLLLLGEGIMPGVIELLGKLHGSFSGRPFMMTYVNPVTPLILNESTSDKMISSIEAGIPVVFSNYGMSGGTTPVDPGGTLTLLNAELLAGVVFSQLVSRGSAIIAGSLPASFNMSTMVSSYSASSYLVNLGCIEMMRHYGLPHCGTSGSGAGWGADINSTGELWLNHLTSCMGGAGIVPFVGGNFDSRAFSPALVIAGNHIIKRTREFMNGLSQRQELPDIDEIINLGPGGDYLTSMSTLTSMSETPHGSGIWPSWSLDQWEAKGSPAADLLFRNHVEELCDRAAKMVADREKIIREADKLIEDLSS